MKHYAFLVQSLPKANRKLFARICALAVRIIMNSEKNKMKVKKETEERYYFLRLTRFFQVTNLATCLGPNLLRAPRDDITTLVQDTPVVNNVAAFLFENAAALFAVRGRTRETSAKLPASSFIAFSSLFFFPLPSFLFFSLPFLYLFFAFSRRLPISSVRQLRNTPTPPMATTN